MGGADGGEEGVGEYMKNARQEWIEKYFKLKFSNDSTPNQIEDALYLKKGELSQIDHLYKYSGRSGIKRLIEALDLKKKAEIRLNDPFDFNDPYDTRVLPVYKTMSELREHFVTLLAKEISKQLNAGNKHKKAISRECIQTLNIEEWHEWLLALAKITKKYDRNHQGSIERLAEEINQKYISDHQKYCKKYQEHLGISCFSEDGKNILMWSHYSEGHKGICLEYDVSSFASLSRTYNIFETALFPVRYQNKSQDLIDLTRKFFTQEFNPSIELTEQEKICFTWKTILTKACCWSYELEWRLVYIFDNHQDESQRLISLKPSHIYLGAKIAEDDEAALRKCAKEHGILINKMQISDDGFELIIGK